MEGRFLLAGDAWTAVAPLPDARTAAMVSGPDGRIYAIGGEGDSGMTSEVDAYDPTTNRWAVVAPLPDARAELGAATGPGGRIYAIGGGVAVGETGETSSSEVDAYDPTTNRWTVVAPLPSRRAGAFAATGPDGRIYAVGGVIFPTDGDGAGVPSTEVDAYDTTTDSWTPVAPLPSARVGLWGTAGRDGRIYALGGYISSEDGDFETSTEVDVYDVSSNTWTTVAPLPDGTYDLAAAAGSDGRIYAIGGLTFDDGMNRDTNAVYAYDPHSNTWASGPPLPHNEQGLGATAGPDGRIYAAGGDNLEDDTESNEVDVLGLEGINIVSLSGTPSPSSSPGINLGYFASGDLSAGAAIEFYWASGGSLDDKIEAEPAYTFQVNTAGLEAPGPHGPIFIPRSAFGDVPYGATHLVASVETLGLTSTLGAHLFQPLSVEEISTIVPPPTAPTPPEVPPGTLTARQRARLAKAERNYQKELNAYDSASSSYQTLTDTIVAYLNSQEAFETYQINYPERQAAFIGQSAVETDGFTQGSELTSRYKSSKSRYKGRGLLQLTGSTNYRLAGEALGVDLLLPHGKPDLLATNPMLGARAAGWYWDKAWGGSLNRYADPWNIATLTSKINAASLGAQLRLSYSTSALAVLNSKL